MADLSAADQARKAIRHTLRQIHERPPVAWYLGHGTQTFALLTEALAAHTDKTIDQIREAYKPAAQRTFDGDELNDCPFCGSSFLELAPNEDGDRKAVHCGDCKAVGPLSYYFDPDENDDVANAEAEAREKWNARTMPHR
jgi:hypothetical protein